MVILTRRTNPVCLSCALNFRHLKMENSYLRRLLTTLETPFSSSVISAMLCLDSQRFCVHPVELGMELYLNVNVSKIRLKYPKQIGLPQAYSNRHVIFADARCVTLSDNKNDGLKVIRDDPESVLVPYRDNVTITCTSPGRHLRNTLTSSFRQCVYDPKPVS